MRRIFLVMLAVLMLLPLVACKQNTQQPMQSQQTVVGSWIATVDMAETVNQMVYAQMGAATVSVTFPVVLELTLSQDGIYTLNLDRQKLAQQIDALGTVLWQMVIEQAAAQSHLTTADAAEAMKNQGKSKELMLEQLNLSSMFENTYTVTGLWKQEADRLLFAQDANALSAMEGYSFTLSGDQLTLTFVQVTEDLQETADKAILFTRHK